MIQTRVSNMGEIRLDDIFAWGKVEILTVTEAALLWAGIDPALCESLDDAKKYYSLKQYQYAYASCKAIISGICTGSLAANEIWCFNHNYGQYEDPYYLYEDNLLPRVSDIAPERTTINMRALISWSEKKRVQTMKQRLERENSKHPTKEPPPKHTKAPEVILEIDYKPKHENPSFEVLQEISKEVWDQIDQGVNPPKQLIINDLIKEKYKKRTGVEPSANIIKQIDAIARPLAFKNKKG